MPSLLEVVKDLRIILWAGLPALLLLLVCKEAGSLTLNFDRITSTSTNVTNDGSIGKPQATNYVSKEILTRNQHQEPRKESVDGALEFLLGRRQSYHDNPDPLVAQRWKMRGNGFLSTRLNIVLSAEGTTWNDTQHIQPGRNVVTIWNVHPKNAHNFQQCHLLSIWVRVAGIEIFAGSAQSVHAVDDSGPCHWEFPFDLQIPGEYHVDARVLLWNGGSPVHFYSHSTIAQRSACPNTTASNLSVIAQEHYPTKTGFLGFKFYSPVSSCCEICRRTEGCQFWQTPPEALGDQASIPRNGCDLFFDAFTTPLSDIPKSFILRNATKTTHIRKATPSTIKRRTRRLVESSNHEEPQPARARYRQGRRRLANNVPNASGTSYNDGLEPAIFLGCGWSFEFSLDFPCLPGNLDDMVFMANPNFEFSKISSLAAANSHEANSTTMAHRNRDDFPLCRAEDESVQNGGNGRWVREPWPDNDGTCPPRTVDASHNSMFDITAIDGHRPYCWHRDDLSRTHNKCLEANCRLIPKTAQWKSSLLYSETKWMGVWRNDQCEYLEFTNQQLQQCIDQRKISSIKTEGASIAANMREFLGARLKGIELYQPVDKNETTLDITLSSLSWPHLIWNEAEDEWEARFKAMRPVAANEEQYWVSSFYVTSEREPYVHLTRAEQAMSLAEQILNPKGYRMINAFNLSAAFSYDTAGQNDGLHILGPPMKMVMTKIFHHMCADVVVGSRV